MAHTWHYNQPENGILRVTINREDESVNSLARESLLELRELLNYIRSGAGVRGVVFSSGKPGNFIAGADVKQLKNLTTKAAAKEISQLGQQVFQELEDLEVPAVALISGACLGGGLEFAMACKYRIADTDGKTKLGLPEVKLGLIPGWGGTVRLPRLIGMLDALPMILTGRMISGYQARSRGLVHDVVPTEALPGVGDTVVNTLVDRRDPTEAAAKLFRPKKKPLTKRLTANNGLVLKYAFSKAGKEVQKNTHGHYPAPFKVIEVLRDARGLSTEEAMELEADGIATLAEDPVTVECMRLFFLQEDAKKAPDWITEPVDPKSIRRAAVIGAGAMGGGIALLLARKGIWTRLKDIKPEFLSAGMQEARRLLGKDTKRRKLTKREAEDALDHLSPTLDYNGLRDADVVIEAIVENIDIKRSVFKELATASNPETVLATNTSSLLVTDMAEETPHPERVVGLHFFNPPHRMPLVEIIRTSKTSPTAIAKSLATVNRLGKTAVVVGDCPGFLVNRLLSPYMNEAGFLLLEVDNPMRIEQAAIDFGMPMGPIELSDLVGLNIAAHVAKNMHDAYGDRMEPAPLWGKLHELKPDKSSELKLIHKSKSGEKSINSKVAKAVEQMKREHGGSTGGEISDEQIVQRLIYPIINEAAICLDEGIAEKPDDIDLAMVFGTGFAPFRGGPMRYADHVGLANIVDRLDAFARTHPRLAVSDALRRYATDNKNFSSVESQPVPAVA